MNSIRLGALLGAAIAVIVQAHEAEAQNAPSPAPAPPSSDEQRYAWLDAELARAEGPTERWYTGWTATYGWLTLGQAALAASAPNAGLRVDAIVGGINSALGLLAMLAAPHTMLGARDRLRRFDASTALGAYERRRRAEYVLHVTAAEERFYGSWIPLAVAVIPSSIGAYVLIHDYHQELAGWATLGAGVGVTLVQVLTRPSIATRAWKRYVDEFHPEPNGQIPPTDMLDLSFAVTPMGVAASGRF
jgi:hypothetical protein